MRGEDRQLIGAFLEMMAAEAGAARNTLLAYERDLRGASELLCGGLAAASADELAGLGAWGDWNVGNWCERVQTTWMSQDI